MSGAQIDCADRFRGDHVHATDGDIGRLRGLRIDTVGRQVTHMLITEGYLHSGKAVAIPFGQVSERL